MDEDIGGLLRFRDELQKSAEQIARHRRQLVAERLRTKFRVIDTNEEKQDDRRGE
jgi:hypothetical protein